MKFILIFLLSSIAFAQSPFLFFLDGVDVDVTAPAKPTGLAATGTVQQISLTWNANSEPDLLYYKLFYRTTDDTTAALDSATINAGTTTKDVTGLTINTVYYFWLKTQDVMGNRSYFSSVASDTAGTYKGSERIIASINRTMEIGSDFISNNTFTSNITGWGGLASTAKWYDTDWNGVGRVNCFLDSSTATNNARFYYSAATVTVNNRYCLTYSYYIPSANGDADIIKPSISDIDLFTFGSTQDSWTTPAKENIKATTAGYLFFHFVKPPSNNVSTVGDKLYIDDVYLKQITNYVNNGSHSVDTSTVNAQAGSYSFVATSSGAGDSTTNHVSLDTLYFTELVPTDYVRLSMYVKSGTASTTMYVRVGNDTQTFVLTTDWANYNYDILVNTYTVKKKIKIWFDKAATVYFDTFSLKKAL